MAAKWSFGTVGIFVDEAPITREVKRAELFVLDATVSTKHYFGAGSRHRKLRGIVIGNTDLETLETDAIGNTSRTLTTAWGADGSWFIHGELNAEPIRYVGGTIDGTNYDGAVTPLYRVELELIKDD